MKTIKKLLFSILLIGIATANQAQTTQAENKKKLEVSPKAEVYYFHNTRRCATCKSVEIVSKKAIQDLYGEKVAFIALNLEDESGKAKAKKLGVSGQTLLIVSGDKKINITNEAFMNARSKPEKLKAIIKEKTDPLI